MAARKHSKASHTASTPPLTVSVSFANEAQRYEAIAVAAYYMSQQRDFEPGHELDDWCRAEQQIDAALELQ